MLRRGIQQNSIKGIRALSAAPPAPKHPLDPQARWENYFKTTPASKAVDYERTGVQATHDGEAFDSKNWNFLEEPVLVDVHRSLEEISSDPLLVLYSNYLQETDPAKRHELGKRVDELLPMGKEQIQEYASRVKKEFVDNVWTVDDTQFDEGAEREEYQARMKEVPGDDAWLEFIEKLGKEDAGLDYAQLQKKYDELVATKIPKLFN